MNAKGILMSILMIGVVAMAAGAGTFAYFSDTETSTENTFTAGTLDLTLSNDGTTYTDGVTATWTASNMKPGDTGVDTLYIKNAGSISGYIDLSGIGVTDAEGANPESETTGVMSDDLKIQLWIDTDGDEVVDVDGAGNLLEESVYPAAAIGAPDPGMATIDGIASSYDLDEPISAGSVINLTMKWELPTGTGNDVQGDSVTLEMTVELDQIAD